MSIAFSVIISTSRRAQHLRLLLEDLSNQEAAAHDIAWEVIVVDNADDVAVERAVADLNRNGAVPIQRIVEPRPGISYGRNTGVVASRFDFIVLMDDDLRIPADFVKRFAEVLRATDADCICPRITTPVPEGAPNWLVRRVASGIGAFDFGTESHQLPDSAKLPVGACVGFSKRMYDRCGPFPSTLGRDDRSLMGSEETFVFANMRRRAAKFYYAAEIHVHHVLVDAKKSRMYWIRHGFDTGRSYIRLQRLIGSAITGPQVVAWLGRALLRQAAVAFCWHEWFEWQYKATRQYGMLFELASGTRRN